MGRNNKHKRGARNKRGPVRSERRPSLTGRVQLHEHSAYVVTENGDYKVMGRGKREIMDGDTVAVSIKNSPHGERRAVIEGVVERAAISVVGTYQTAWCDRAARFASEGRLLHSARGYLGGLSGRPPG